MFSVTKRIETVSQPQGGYVPKSLFVEEQYDDRLEIAEVEAAFAGIQGMATDYLTRFMMTSNKLTAFKISILGAAKVDMVNENASERKRIMSMLDSVNGLDDVSIFNACRIVGYDVAFRLGVKAFQSVTEINPPPEVIKNIRIMVNRSLEYLRSIGPIVLDEVTFEGGYTSLVSSGDGDYLTADALVDLKASKKEFSSKWSLQVLMYYLLGIHSKHEEFQNVKKICIFNPLLNKSYTVNIDDVSDESKYKVSHEVLGYKMQRDSYCYDFDKHEEYHDYSTWRLTKGSDTEIKRLVLSRNMKTDFKADDYADGMHDITVDDYWTYLHSVDKQYEFELRPVFNNTVHVIMIKKNGFLMFLSSSRTGKICILNGARIKEAEHSPKFYYDNIERYGAAVLKRFSKYWDALYLTSAQLRKLKPSKKMLRKNNYSEHVQYSIAMGRTPMKFDEWYEQEGKNIRLSGKVHGCIIDLDYSNHIYVNPYDGKVIPYNAVSMYDKNVYKNTASLIAAQKPEMLESFQKFVEKEPTSLLAMDSSEGHELINLEDEKEAETIKVYSYDMYDVSNKLKAYQYVYDAGLIKVWNDRILGNDVAMLEDGLRKKEPSEAEIDKMSMIPALEGTSAKSKYVGMTKTMNCGMRATIIDYVNYGDVEVMFEDGLIRHHVRVDKFKAGKVGHVST